MDCKRIFSEDHIWIMGEENTFQLGITDYAQEQLREIVLLNLPNEGERLEKGLPFGDIEGIKTVFELISPVNGKVVRVNEELINEPERIHKAPYESWLIQVDADLLPGGLMDEGAYLSYHGI